MTILSGQLPRLLLRLAIKKFPNVPRQKDRMGGGMIDALARPWIQRHHVKSVCGCRIRLLLAQSQPICRLSRNGLNFRPVCMASSRDF